MAIGLTGSGGFFDRLFGRQSNGGAGKRPSPAQQRENDRRAALERARVRRLEDLEQEVLAESMGEELAANLAAHPKREEPGDEWIYGGDWMSFPSSNVQEARYLREHQQLFIIYHDGSAYQYDQISEDEARSFYVAPSHGKWVWDNLRVRSTIFGYRKPYILLDAASRTARQWMRTRKSRTRHGKIKPSGRTKSGRVIRPEDLHR